MEERTCQVVSRVRTRKENVELSVISIKMVRDRGIRENVTQRRSVKEEKKRVKDKTLTYTCK